MKLCLSCERVFQDETWHCPLCGWSPIVENELVIFAPNLVRECGGFSSDFFAILADLESGHFWFKARNRLLCWALGAYFPAVKSFFEVGCGTGFVLSGIGAAFPALDLFGSDVLVEGLRHARGRLPGATLWQMDARCIPFEEEFDVIGAFDVVEHVEEDERVLAQLFKATKTGGGIMITAPQHPFLWSKADEHSFHKRRYTKTELVAKVQRAGFTVETTTSFVMLPLPLMVLSRLRNRCRGQDYDPLAELMIGALPNHVLEWLMLFEFPIIKAGFSLPIGGSLLLVAKRHGR